MDSLEHRNAFLRATGHHPSAKRITDLIGEADQALMDAAQEILRLRDNQKRMKAQITHLLRQLEMLQAGIAQIVDSE